MNLLFTCAGRRNYLIRYFKEIIGGNGKVIAVDSEVTAPALAEADMAMTVPSVFATNYVETLTEIIRDHKIDLVIPLNDLELPIISKNRNKLEAFGAKVVVSDPDLIDLCADKWKTFKYLERLKIPTVKTYKKLEDALVALSDQSLNFPIILKPRWGFGSVGIEIVSSETELRLAYQLLSIKINKTLMSSTGVNSSKNPIIIQEKINGEEYGVDIINDFNSQFYGAFARKKLAMRSGETDKAVSVIDNRLTDMAEKIGKATGHIGVMDCDFFIKDGEIQLLEMNPRFGGGYPFSHIAGINVPGIYVEWMKGNRNVEKYNGYEANVLSSKYDWIMKIKNGNSEVD
ncbi:hypothetical protein LCGC14_1337480 [marine sediment metagenome]|uniref:ATP-grasp domain-containing protein n=2 Tax=root TaxID=1 RepID=A0A831QW10_9FLAO|nr:ATP-grasp domain-containing protein [Pricia antarctica]